MFSFSNLNLLKAFKLEGHCNRTNLLLEEDLSLRDVSQQELHGDAQLGHVLLEAWSRVLGSLPPGLQEMTVSIGVGQLDSLDTAQVVVIPRVAEVRFGVKYQDHPLLPGPLAVARLLGEGALQHQLVSLSTEYCCPFLNPKIFHKNVTWL